MNIFIPLILGLLVFLCGAYVLLLIFHKKLCTLESRLLQVFRSRTDTIPSVYEISKPYLTKHKEIFDEALRLKKTEFSLLEGSEKVYDVIETEWLIHHEINFIFKVCNKHPKLLKDGNFIYIRDIVIQRSKKLWDMIQFYKTMVKRYNRFIQLKNYSILWLLLPISKKTEI